MQAVQEKLGFSLVCDHGPGNLCLVGDVYVKFMSSASLVDLALRLTAVNSACGSRVAIRETFNASSYNEDETLGTSFQFANLQASDYKYEQGVGA